MAGMDITERRLAQDGHIANAVLKQQRDIRVGSGPTMHGERLVLRLMPDQTTFTSLDDLGYDEDQLALMKKYVRAFVRHDPQCGAGRFGKKYDDV